MSKENEKTISRELIEIMKDASENLMSQMNFIQPMFKKIPR